MRGATRFHTDVVAAVVVVDDVAVVVAVAVAVDFRSCGMLACANESALSILFWHDCGHLPVYEHR